MATYRIYVMSRDGGRLPHRDVECADPEAAFTAAAELARGARSAEVWAATELLGEVRAAGVEVHFSVPPVVFPNRTMMVTTGN